MAHAKSRGKIFEEDIMSSIPDEYFKFKLRDSASSWNGNGESDKRTSRFTIHNPCDIIAFMDKPYLLECKAHAGASIPLSPHIKIKSKKVKGIPTQIEVIDNYGVIKKTQIDEMFKYATTTNAKAYFIFQLYEKGKAYLVPVIDVHFAIYRAGRKSLSLEWLNEFGIPILFKPKGRSEMHFVYDLSYLYK